MEGAQERAQILSGLWGFVLLLALSWRDLGAGVPTAER